MTDALTIDVARTYVPSNEEREAIELTYTFGMQFGMDVQIEEIWQVHKQCVEVRFTNRRTGIQSMLKFTRWAPLDPSNELVIGFKEGDAGPEFEFPNQQFTLQEFDEESWFIPHGMDPQDSELQFGSNDERRLAIRTFLAARQYTAAGRARTQLLRS